MATQGVLGLDKVVLNIGGFSINRDGLVRLEIAPAEDASITVYGSNNSSSTVFNTSQHKLVTIELLPTADSHGDIYNLLSISLAVGKAFPFAYRDPSKTNQFVISQMAVVEREATITHQRLAVDNSVWVIRANGTYTAQSGSSSSLI